MSTSVTFFLESTGLETSFSCTPRDKVLVTCRHHQTVEICDSLGQMLFIKMQEDNCLEKNTQNHHRWWLFVNSQSCQCKWLLFVHRQDHIIVFCKHTGSCHCRLLLFINRNDDLIPGDGCLWNQRFMSFQVMTVTVSFHCRWQNN